MLLWAVNGRVTPLERRRNQYICIEQITTVVVMISNLQPIDLIKKN